MPLIPIRKFVVPIVVATIVLVIIARTDWQVARETDHYPSCQQNLHQILLSLHAFQADKHHFPRGTSPNPKLEPKERVSWLADLLPYLDDPEMYAKIDRSQPWNQGVNRAIASTDLNVVHCVIARQSTSTKFTSTRFVGIAGLGLDAPLLATNHPRAGVFGYDRQSTLADMKDGTAYTMMLAEVKHGVGSWMQGGSATVLGLDPENKPYFGRGRVFGHSSRPGTNIAMADGSVRWFAGSVNPRIFEAFSTIAGGEKVPANWQD